MPTEYVVILHYNLGLGVHGGQMCNRGSVPGILLSGWRHDVFLVFFGGWGSRVSWLGKQHKVVSDFEVVLADM